MAEGRSAARRVLELKERLACAQEPEEETGIGKTVNSFRKHATAGNVAKTLVKQWKKLIPPENKSGHRGGKQNTEKEKHETKSSVSKEIKPSEKSKASVLASRSSSSAPISKKLNKQRTCSENTHQSRDSDPQKECDNKECSSSGSKHASRGTNAQAKESAFKETTYTDSKKVSEKQCSSVANKDLSPLKEKPSKDASEQKNPKHVKKTKQKLVIKSKAKLPSDDEFEPPTMSFESYLNYDQVTKKRKRKACSTSKLSHAKEGEEDVKKREDDLSETSNKKVKETLPDVLIAAFLAPAVEAPQQVSDTVQFTGRRLNSKMQVYSGSKTVCLSKMLTLYEQCIRVLQNNIDSLHEVGGVPFEILEPVLTRCTPEQLFRIEECNSAFTEESDHLWKKHCQRDFKNESLLECESWREMYLRLFNQREEKLKMLTKNILSAQSEKPKVSTLVPDSAFPNLNLEIATQPYYQLSFEHKGEKKVAYPLLLAAVLGRQVKMAYVTSAAKPPRNIRRKQEIHGTAGPVAQLHPIEKCK
ncbi:hypothetical protein QYF61_022504 [Mycteria americana]|uniref:Elongin-A n=1 Tax=Mycteria americana TaxID=33587 RepID=A0AAN7PES6_MYCAM|nr:hypothetical protein QYF61_022504 [Mycteria americana]